MDLHDSNFYIDSSDFDPILEAIEPLALILESIFDDPSFKEYLDRCECE